MVKFREIPAFTSMGNYRVNMAWEDLESALRRYANRGQGLGGLQLDPDFQRGHVWTQEKKIAYVEYILRGGYSSKDIYFNNGTWQGSYKDDTVLVDGKQRLDAVLGFLRNEVPAFGHYYREFEDSLPSHAEFVFNINNLKTRREVLQWYLDLNTGGVVHTEEELNRVRDLLLEETGGDIKAVKGAVGRLIRQRVREGRTPEEIIVELAIHEVEEKFVRWILEDIENETH